MNGALLNLSYGRGRIEIVVMDETAEGAQGALCALPLPDFPTGIMRGRFHPETGQLYVCGLSAWGSSQAEQEGGFYRLRRTGKPAYVPVRWHIARNGIELTFSDVLERGSASDRTSYAVKVWGLRRSAEYGSPRINERSLTVSHAELLPDGRTLRLTLPSLAPTEMIEITCELKDEGGQDVVRVITGTIHRLSQEAFR
jgi:hypothetical protein